MPPRSPCARGGHVALHLERSAPASGIRMTGLPAATRDWLAGPGLTRLWGAMRKRLEGNGVQATGSLRLTAVSNQERNDLSLLLGKPLTGIDVTVRLDALDARLRTSAAGLGLREVLDELGPPLTDRRAARAGVAAQRRHVWSSLTTSLDASPLADQEWTRQWSDVLRRTGIPRGVTPEAAVQTLQQAVRVLTVLLDPERNAARGRGELAAMATGSAHGLDDGTWLARLVQRGVALAHGTEFPSNAAGRRALWRLVSVTPDEVSSTVLTYGLRPIGEGWRERSLRERAAHHAETHLTPRDLLDVHLQLPAGTVVHICENPRVVEAAADAACAKPLVCTSGSAATVVLTLLDALATTGCRFAYHGDFDWPGIALANRIIRRYEALPWRMGAEDYERLATHSQAEGIPQLPLDGRTVSADWDPGLAPAMTALGVALHEEATLDLLVDDLSGQM
ncbi:TIGR02679 family protein [Streptomyces sp. NPDC051658]|uniref:TIGR02679 family protein n=1 Tax=Streptomyces sp. NPDC051658 TaxID=3365667 RepID=UPI0037A53ACC